MSVTATYEITGMTCGHCVSAVTDELRALPGVEEVRVDLDPGLAHVTSTAALDRTTVAAAVDEAGYALAGDRP